MNNAFDNLKLCAYLFVADSFDNSLNVYERFCPLLELLLAQKTDKYTTITSLCDEFNKTYDLKVSRATLSELINRLSRQGKVKTRRDSVEVNGDCFNKNYLFEKSKKETEICDLFIDFTEYLVDKKYLVKPEEVKELLCRFVFEHSYQLFDLLSGSGQIESKDTEDFPAEFAEHLYNYLIHCKSNKPDKYSSFQRLHNGAVQASLLNFNPNKLKKFTEKELEINQLVLDSNFIMRVLDLQTEADCLTAQDTLKILKNKNIQLVVLKETIQEISTTIKNFLTETSQYTSYTKEFYKSKGIKFNGLHAALQRGKTRTSLQEISLYENLKQLLTSDKIGFIVNEDEAALCQDNDLIDSLIKAKDRENYRAKQAQHDIALINWCKKNRPRSVSSVKSAKSWVLTNDIKLTYWNKKNTNSDIQECITESQLCHLLWIEEPKQDGKGMITTILTLANRNSINNGELEAFIKHAESYKQTIESSSEIDAYTLAFNSDLITTKDIKYAYSSQEDFENLIRTKAKAHKEEMQKKDTVIKEQKENEEKLQKQIKIQDLKNAQLQLENGNLQLFSKKENLELQKKELDTKIEHWKSLQKTSNKVAASITLAGCILLAIISILLFQLFKTDIKEWLDVSFNTTLLTTVFTGAILFIGYILSLFMTAFVGEPFSFKSLFPYIQNKIFKKLLIKNGIPENFTIEDGEKQLEVITNDIVDISNKLKTNSEEIQNIKYQIIVLETV